MDHRALIVNNEVNKKELIRDILAGRGEFEFTQGLDGAVFSHSAIEYFLEEEARHDRQPLTEDTPQAFRTYSSGEKKKALLKYVLARQRDFLILDNPFDHLDKTSREELESQLAGLSSSIMMVQLVSRVADILPFVKKIANASDPVLKWRHSINDWPGSNKELNDLPIPPPPDKPDELPEHLFRISDVHVSYGEKPVLNNISWAVKRGEFWELSGPNGSGKTTLLSMITGDNPKAYGQDIEIMGFKKGSGESVWDIKKHIGYFSPAITYRFRGHHSVRNMVVSGLYDSIGLYVKPSDTDCLLADRWLEVINMRSKAKTNFRNLSEGEKRLVLCARAMVKHPPLLILDEPTSSLDDPSARLVVDLVNKMALESRTAIIFVSHRKEPNLRATNHYKLVLSPVGSSGRIIS